MAAGKPAGAAHREGVLPALLCAAGHYYLDKDDRSGLYPW